MLFAGPFEDDIDWKLIAGDDPHKRPGVTPGSAGCSTPSTTPCGDRTRRSPTSSRRATAPAVQGVTDDLERFRFNMAISKLQVLTNEMRAALDAGGGAREAAAAHWRCCWRPFAPFAAEELWREVLGNAESVHLQSWPTFDPSLVVRGHGHTGHPGQRQGARPGRGLQPTPTRPRSLELARASENARRAIGDGRVVKEIVRAPKLVNLVAPA